MAGGLFDEDVEEGVITPQNTDAGVEAEVTTGGTSGTSPGGLFKDGENVTADRAAFQHSSLAEDFAASSQGWAVGTSTQGLNDWSSENNSKYYSEQANLSADAANASAADSETSSQDADASAASATASATAATASQTAAAGSQAAALISENNAATSETNSATSAAAALVSQNTAKTSEDNAATSATAANSSAVQALNSRNLAQIAEDAAETSAAAALVSENAAKTSETNAATSETNASTSATSAASSATTATTQAANASSDADDAEAWAVGQIDGVDVLNGADQFDNNAKYWSEQAQSFATGTNYGEGNAIDIIEDDVNNTVTIATYAIQAGHDISVVQNETANTILISSLATGGGGGETPVVPNQSKITVTPNPTVLELAESGTSTVAITVALTSGYTAVTTVVTVRDVENVPVAVTTATEHTNYTFTADLTESGTYHITVVATVTRDSDSPKVNYTDSRSATVTIDRPFYHTLGITQPAFVLFIPNKTIWTGSATITYTGTGGNNRLAYVALPTDSGETYEFKSGSLFADVTNLGVISTNWTLFRFNDYDDSAAALGDTFIFDITEN